MRIKIGRGWVRVVTALLGCGLLVGCSYNKKVEEALSLYETGQFTASAAKVTSIADKVVKHDALLIRCEQGAILRAAGQFEASNAAFTKADDKVKEYDAQPETQISQEAGAVLVNATVMNYRGFAYDRIMLSTYKALNALELGNSDLARVEFNRAMERQKDAVVENDKQIDRSEKLREEKKSSADVEKVQSDPGVQKQLETEYADLVGRDMSAYADYVNPFAEYARALYLMYSPADTSDLEQATSSIRRVSGMLGNDNAFFKKELVLSDKIASGAKVEPTTYVIYEAGLAPEREEIRIDIPVFLFNIGVKDTKVDYVGVAFPKLEKRYCNVLKLKATAGGQTHAATLVCDMDKVVSQEFKNQMPIVITRTIISAGIKAAAQYAVAEATRKQNLWVQLLARAGTAIYAAATNHADLRTWRTLPKQISVARFPTPADRIVNLQVVNGLPIPPVTLQPGTVNVIFVKCVHSSATPIVTQFKLK